MLQLDLSPSLLATGLIKMGFSPNGLVKTGRITIICVISIGLVHKCNNNYNWTYYNKLGFSPIGVIIIGLITIGVFINLGYYNKAASQMGLLL